VMEREPERGAVDVEAVLSRHAYEVFGGGIKHCRYCCTCDREPERVCWPCDAVRLAQQLAAAEAQRARLERAIRELTDAASIHPLPSDLSRQTNAYMRLSQAIANLSRLVPPSAAPQAGEHFGSHPDCADNLACSCHASCPHRQPSAAPGHTPACQVSRRYPFAAELSCTCRAVPSGGKD
jgi:hypothetical protein